MTRWIFRAIGLLMLVVFLILLSNLQRRLAQMQQTQSPAPSPASATR